MKAHFERFAVFFRKHGDRWWIAPLIAFTAFADLFVLVIPTDGLIVSYMLVAPQRWLRTGLIVALGSALGSAVLAAVLHHHGLPFLLHIRPDIQSSFAWTWSVGLMNHWGPWAVFIIALSPVLQHPIVALAALAGMPLLQIFLLVLLARAIKYSAIAWIATHAPKVLHRLWGIQYELREVGIKRDS
jgi:membrane protein YqaA with SNARE-associated domain